MSNQNISAEDQVFYDRGYAQGYEDAMSDMANASANIVYYDDGNYKPRL